MSGKKSKSSDNPLSKAINIFHKCCESNNKLNNINIILTIVSIVVTAGLVFATTILAIGTVWMGISAHRSTNAAIETAQKTSELIETQLAPPQIILSAHDPDNLIIGISQESPLNISEFFNFTHNTTPYYYVIFNPSDHAIKLKNIIYNSECFKETNETYHYPITVSKDNESTILPGKSFSLKLNLPVERLKENYKEELPCVILFNISFFNSKTVTKNITLRD